jgi:molybdopterin synthase sulfur carrier subunit
MTVAAHSEVDGAESEQRAAGTPTIVLLLFAAARVAAGTGRDVLRGRDVAEVLAVARGRYGADFAAVLDGCRVWVNGSAVTPEHSLAEGDEVAVLPPVSGGADEQTLP